MAARVPKLNGKPHAHGCERCHRRIEDNCNTPTIDPLCYSCRTGNPPAVWDKNRLPIACCYEHSRPVSQPERVTYKLAGLRAWHICTWCKRTFPIRPQRSPDG